MLYLHGFKLSKCLTVRGHWFKWLQMKQRVNDVNMTINAHILVLKSAVVVVVMQAKLIKIISAE